MPTQLFRHQPQDRSFYTAKLVFLAAAIYAIPCASAAPTSESLTPPTRWQRRAEEKKQLGKDIVWFSHEPLAFLLRRGGEHQADEPERYATMCSSANIRQMAAAGVKYSQLYFYKGFGIDFERPNFENARRVAAEMHALGMQISLYVGGTMFTETLYREEPAAKNWERRDQNDHWISYGAQTFRHYACSNEPAYRAYIKRVLKYAVEEVKPDEIFFDNIMLQAEPESCRCPRCQTAFHEFLRQKYPTESAVRRRFGLPSIDLIQVNEWSSAEQAAGVTELRDPVLQEWVRFRCEYLARATTELADYVKQLNPRIAVTLNLKGVYSFNRYWTNAVYQPLYAGHFDNVDFDTGGFDARLDPQTGALVSQIRTYKMARRLGVGCIDFIQEDDLRAAIHMAFTYQKPGTGLVGAPWHEGLNNVTTPLLEFFREYNDRYFTGTENVADVAVFHNWPSLAYTLHEGYSSTTLTEQVLIQHKIPFDFLYEEEIGRLNRYKAVVVAGQECLSAAQAVTLLDYVRGGGTLILTDNTGQYNEWREPWPRHPLLPARTEGLGRIVWIPHVIPAAPPKNASAGVNPDPEPGAALKPGQQMWPPDWVLPVNHAEIAHTVSEAIDGGPSVRTDAPLTTVLEILNRPASHETMIHLINFEAHHPLSPVQVRLKKQYPGKVRSVKLVSPERNDPISLPFRENGSLVECHVPTLNLYALVVVDYD